MKKKNLWIPLVLLGVVLVSGCTSLSVDNEMVNINNNPYDTFKDAVRVEDCDDIFHDDYPQEDSWTCWINKVDLQAKTFNCGCIIERGIL